LRTQRREATSPGFTLNYVGEQFLLATDALNANGPYIEQLQHEDHSFIIGIKQDGNKTLFKQFATRQKSCQAKQNSY
jgi:hypothetical protein